MKLYSIPLVALSLSLSLHATSAQAQSAQTPALWGACNSLEGGHPASESCETFLEGFTAEEPSALQEGRDEDTDTLVTVEEPILLDQTVEQSRLIAIEGEETQVRTRSQAAADEESRVSIEPESESENSSSTRRRLLYMLFPILQLVERSRPMEMESTETQTRWNAGSVLIIGVGAYGGASAAGISWGIWSLASGDPANDIAGYASMAVGGIVGGLLGRSISNKIWGYDGDDDTRAAQFYVAPYLHEDASGLTFSSRF
jgi:hypothetical protein